MQLFDKNFQLKIFKLMLIDDDFYNEYYNIFDIKLIVDANLRLVFESIYKIRESGIGGIIDKEILIIELNSKGKPEHIDKEILLSTVEDIYNTSIKNSEFISRKFIEFIRKEKVKNALVDSVEILKEGKPLERIMSIIENAFVVNEDLNRGIFLEDFTSLREKCNIRYKDKNVIKTGIELYDKALLGGMAPGEVHVVQAISKSGKTSFAVNLGASNCLEGKTVVDFTLELSEFDIAVKYLCRLTGMSIDDIITLSDEEYKDRIKKINNIGNKLIIKHYVSHTIDCNVLKSYIISLKKRGIEKVDLIIVDYDDLMLPTIDYNDSLYQSSGCVYSDFIKLAEYFKCPVFTLSQVSRKDGAWGKNKRDEYIEASDIAHSSMKINNCWSVTSINNFPDENNNRRYLYVDLVRNGIGDTIIPISADLSRSWFRQKEEYPI